MSNYNPSNVFAKILRGEIPCRKVHEGPHVLAFPDLHPKAPVHILVIPKGAYVDVADFGARASEVEIAAFWRAVSSVARDAGLTAGGFRIIANAGVNGGQEVLHFHVHILGGKCLGPMASGG
jgi:histidine triad (HIT) family protein